MKRQQLFLLMIMVFLAQAINALPALETPVPLGNGFEGIITIYPDSENTAQIRRYWLVPNTARIVRKPDNKLAFGLIHSGVSGFDPDGIKALLNVTVQPYVDANTLQRAEAIVQKTAQQEGATSVTFTYIAPTESTAQLLVGGQFIDWSDGAGGHGATVVSGGSVDAGIPFQYKVSDSFDVRCLTQEGGPDAAAFGVLYTMKFNGVGDRVHFIVTANFKEVYDHTLAHVKASGWFGAVSGDFKAEWQSLQDDGAVKLQIISGKKEDIDKFHADEIVQKLLEQITNRSGIFAQKLKANGLPDSPGGGGLFGWGVSASGGFEHYDQTTELRVEIDAQYTREQQIAFGMNFPTGGDELKSYVKNVTDSNKPFPTDADFKAQKQQNKVCRDANLTSLDKLLANHTITQDQHDKYVDNAIQKGCYVDYTISADAKLRTGNMPSSMLLDFISNGHNPKRGR